MLEPQAFNAKSEEMACFTQRSLIGQLNDRLFGATETDSTRNTLSCLSYDSWP